MVDTTRTTVVTGASTGIGRASAIRQARGGDRVWAIVRDPSRSVDLVEQAREERLPLTVVEGDVSKDSSVDAAFDQILSDGRVDRLVNNAGLFYSSTLEGQTLKELHEVFEVNYFGAMRCVRKVLPGMRQSGSGVICAVSSNSAQSIFPSWAAYSGSKAALEASLESVAMETAALGIRVSIIQPGITLTSMRSKIKPRTNPDAYEETLTRYRTVIAADRNQSMDPDDVATAIENALTDASTPFRVQVGADAVRNVALRRRVGDDEWVRLFSPDSDDKFYADWAARIGGPDPRTVLDERLMDPTTR